MGSCVRVVNGGGVRFFMDAEDRQDGEEDRIHEGPPEETGSQDERDGFGVGRASGGVVR